MIPLVDLKAQYRSIKSEIDAAVLNALESASFVLGPDVAAFEESFASYCGVKHAIAVNSGTSALHLALLAAGIGEDDEVITVSMTFVATVSAILYVGARPVFVDVDPVTWTMDPTRIEAAITPRTKAILPVHLHGLCADMTPILDIAKRHRLVVIEDAAQAHGAEYRDQRAGSFGQLGCFSFYPGKNLGAYGEGGAVVTNDPALADRVRMLRNWGEDRKYHHVLRGYNYRMDGIQGAVLRVKMRHIDAWTEARRAASSRYDAFLSGIDVRCPSPAAGHRHAYHVYAVRVARRDTVAAHLREAGIATGIHYPVPVHLQPAYSSLGHGPGSLPVSEQLAAEFLSLPMFPELTAQQVTLTVNALRQALAGAPIDA